MVTTLAWTRLDFTMPGWAFLGGTKLVWTATVGGERKFSGQTLRSLV